MQVKIEGLEQAMAQILENQKKMNEYILELEESLVSLEEAEEGSIEQEIAKKIIRRIKQKIKKRKAANTVEHLEEEEQQLNKRSMPLTILRRKTHKEENKKNNSQAKQMKSVKISIPGE